MGKRVAGRRPYGLILGRMLGGWWMIVVLLALGGAGAILVGLRQGDCLWAFLIGFLLAGGACGWLNCRMQGRLLRLFLSLLEYFHRFELRNRHPRRRVKKFKVFVKQEPSEPEQSVHEQDFEPPLENGQEWEAQAGGLPSQRVCQVRFEAAVETVDINGNLVDSRVLEQSTPVFEAPYGVEDCIVTLDMHDRLLYQMWYIDPNGLIVQVPSPPEEL
jgi:hypothetical protein